MRLYEKLFLMKMSSGNMRTIYYPTWTGLKAMLVDETELGR